MANFTTHIAVGTVVAGGLATLTLAADVVAPENLVAVTMAGVLGSVLPDIDLKDSRPSRAMFAGLGVFVAGGGNYFGREFFGKRLVGAGFRVSDQPAGRQRIAALGTHLDRNLIVGSTDAA